MTATLVTAALETANVNLQLVTGARPNLVKGIDLITKVPAKPAALSCRYWEKAEPASVNVVDAQ